MDCCATRLRITVKDASLLDDTLLKSTGASGVVHKGNGVQIIYGPHVTVIKSNLEDYLETAPDILVEREGIEYSSKSDSIESNGIKDAEVEASKMEKALLKSVIISSPITGVAGALSTAPDDAFAQGMLGDGVVVIPKKSEVCAPEDREIVFVFDTKHALGFKTDSDITLLIHLGIDTVKLGGQGFEVMVENGQKVKKGEMLIKIDIDYVSANAPSLASPILCTELSGTQKVRLLKEGDIITGEELFAVDFYE